MSRTPDMVRLLDVDPDLGAAAQRLHGATKPSASSSSAPTGCPWARGTFRALPARPLTTSAC